MKIIRPLLLLTVAALIAGSMGMSKAEYAKKEGKPCAFCHTKMGSPEVMGKSLTDAGKYYKAHDHSLKGYKAPAK